MNARFDASKGAPAKALEAPADSSTDSVDVPKKPLVSRRFALMLGVPLLLAVVGGYFWLTGGRYETTDNAYVQQVIVPLSTDVSGRVSAVSVRDDEHVTAGQLLFNLDAEPYEIAKDQAEAALATARVNVRQLQVAYATAQARHAAAQLTLDIRTRGQERVTQLANNGVSSEAAQDTAALSVQQAQSEFDLSTLAMDSAAAALGGDPKIEVDKHPAVRAALGALKVAERNLDKTAIVAPADGVISQMESLTVGKYMSAGAPAASLVEVQNSWVEANFKETQLGGLKLGQDVDVDVDAYPGVALHGKITGIGAGTGAQFSLIPAQNATGNWVKVVQRIPVRISVQAEDGVTLRAGMSASVSVDTGRSRLGL